MPVTLHNRSWQMQVFNLVHDAYCRGRACLCSEITTVVVEENVSFRQACVTAAAAPG